MKDKLDNETNMKNDDIRALAFGQYILFICSKQPVSIYLGKRNNVDKPAVDPPWWPLQFMQIKKFFMDEPLAHSSIP